MISAVLSVSWQQEEYMVSESGVPLMVCAMIVAGSLERDVSVAVESMDGTALAGMYTTKAILCFIFNAVSWVYLEICSGVVFLSIIISQRLKAFSTIVRSVDQVKSRVVDKSRAVRCQSTHLVSKNTSVYMH